MIRTRCPWIFIALLCTTAACSGERGPAGPAGPTGPQGSQGTAGPTVPANQLPCPQPDAGIAAIPLVDTGLTCVETGAAAIRDGTFPSAMTQCQQLGLRLCTYGEWYAACKNFSDRLTRLTDDWEWVDAVYPDGDGGVRGLVVGNGNCEAARLESLGEPHYVRCCQ